MQNWEIQTKRMKNSEGDFLFLLDLRRKFSSFNISLTRTLSYSLQGAELRPLWTPINPITASPLPLKPLFCVLTASRIKSHLEGGCFNSLSAFMKCKICIEFPAKISSYSIGNVPLMYVYSK